MAKSPKTYRARLRIRSRRSAFAGILPYIRWVITLCLIVAMVVSIGQRLVFPPQAGALEFTPHSIGSEGGAVGVYGVKAADMDGDGDIDVVTIGDNGLRIYENDGNNTFTQKIIDDKKGDRLQLVDFTGDDRPDILATFSTSPSLRVYKNEGGLEFSGSAIGTGTNARAIAMNVDKDNDIDIIAAADEGGGYVIRVWKNDGDALFTSSTVTSSGDPSVTAIGASDFDGEGYPDFAISGDGGLYGFDTSDGDTWTRYDIDTDNKNHSHLVVQDVNGDEKPDIVLAKQSGDSIEWYRYKGTNEFDKGTIDTDVDATTVQVVDIDEDGDNDILVAAQDDDAVYWYDNDGDESFTQRTIASDITSVLGIDAVDFDGDDDIDVVTADHANGTVWWYEQTLSKPSGLAPYNIRQTVDGAGRVTFDTTISDSDFKQTRIRVQYSTDGEHWYKPWLLKVTPAQGSVDLKNSNGYQVGTANGIDTDDYESVKLTLLWDTKSVENTGGPIVGDISTVKLRIIPFNGQKIGTAAISSEFRVDNEPPQGLANLRSTETTETTATVAWDKPTDSSDVTYHLYYGTDYASVLEQRSSVWNATNDSAMNDSDTTSTTVTGLTAGTVYTFKMWAADSFGNTVAAPSTKVIASAATPTPTATPTTGITPTTSPEVTVTPTATPSTSPTESPSTTPEATISPTPLFTSVAPTPPPTLFENAAPLADAGIDQAVNPSALVILDGSASDDPDNDPLTYVWRQIAGPAVDLVSARTATPSFSAGRENDTYIFALTVRDRSGASATDTVTVAVRPLPQVSTVPVQTVGQEEQVQVSVETTPSENGLSNLLSPLNLWILILSILLTASSLIERVLRGFRRKESSAERSIESAKGKVVHYRTAEPISGALVLVYSADGKLRSRERTNAKGEFSTLFPAGQYSLGVQSENFAFSPAASPAIKPEEGILYAGGTITVPPGGKPVTIVVPMKPTGKQVTATRTRFLHIWQSTQRWARVLTWPVFVVGSILNTALIFLSPSLSFLAFEIVYVVLIVVKVTLEVRMRPAYGLVRDAITHVPADLAVVRLFEQGTNRLIMTRVTDSQGRFFALPPTGTYTVTVTKPGYAIFSKDNVAITAQQDSVLQLTADLMPVAPQSALADARAAII